MRRARTNTGEQMPLGTLLRRIAAASRARVAARMQNETWAMAAGFRPGCVGVMFCIRQLQPVSQRGIGAVLGLDPSDVVGLIDILEGAGLVERARDPSDRRRYSLRLTASGQRAHSRLLEVLERATEDLLAPLSVAERRQFLRLLERVVGPDFAKDRNGRPSRA